MVKQQPPFTRVQLTPYTQVLKEGNTSDSKMAQNTTSVVTVKSLNLMGMRLFIRGLNILQKQGVGEVNILSLKATKYIINEGYENRSFGFFAIPIFK